MHDDAFGHYSAFETCALHAYTPSQSTSTFRHARDQQSEVVRKVLVGVVTRCQLFGKFLPPFHHMAPTSSFALTFL